MRAVILYWVSVAFNFGAAGVNCWLIYRNVQLRKRDRAALHEATDKVMHDLAPAIAFCVLMREMPGVPPSIKQLAAESIPDGVEVFASTPLQQPSSKIVH